MYVLPMTDPNGAAILMVTWIPSTKNPVMLAFFYQHQPDPMGFMGVFITKRHGFQWKKMPP